MGEFRIELIYNIEGEAAIDDLTEIFTITLSNSDSGPCTSDLTGPSLTLNSGYTVDSSDNWIAYEIGAASNLVLTWAGGSNGNCDFTTSVTVDGSAVPSWVTHTEV